MLQLLLGKQSHQHRQLSLQSRLIQNTRSKHGTGTDDVLLGLDVVLFVVFKVVDHGPVNLALGIHFKLVALGVGPDVKQSFPALIKVLWRRQFSKNSSSARPLNILFVTFLASAGQRHALHFTIGVGLSKDTVDEPLANRIVKSIVVLLEELLSATVERVPLTVAEKVRPLNPLVLPGGATCPVGSHTTNNTSCGSGRKVTIGLLLRVLAIEYIGPVSGSFHVSVVPIEKINPPYLRDQDAGSTRGLAELVGTDSGCSSPYT
jgi:hypothetical protein